LKAVIFKLGKYYRLYKRHCMQDRKKRVMKGIDTV
jgi:hypothetical protein